MRGGGREAQEGVDTYTLRAGSYCHTAESNTTLQSNYPPIENKLKKENTQLNGVVRYLQINDAIKKKEKFTKRYINTASESSLKKQRQLNGTGQYFQ